MLCWLQACSKFVNCNAVTKLGRGSSKSPELLARYCDTLLKKSAKNPDETEMEDALQAVVSGKQRSGVCTTHSRLRTTGRGLSMLLLHAITVSPSTSPDGGVQVY